MSKGPVYRAFTLVPRRDEDGEEQKFWLNVGSVFEHADGKGLTVILDALPLDGKLVLREPKEPEPDPKKYARK